MLPSPTAASRRRTARSPSATARHERRGSSPPEPHQLFGSEVRPTPSLRRRPVDIETELSVRPHRTVNREAEPSVWPHRFAAAPSEPGAAARRSAPGRDSKLARLARSAEVRIAGRPETSPHSARTSELSLGVRTGEALASDLRRTSNADCDNNAVTTAAPSAVPTAGTIAGARATRRAIDLVHSALRGGDFKQASIVLSQPHATDTGQRQGVLRTVAGQRSADTLQQLQLEPHSEQQAERTLQTDRTSSPAAPRRLRTVYIDGGDRPSSRGRDEPPSNGTEDGRAECRIPLVE